MTAFTPAAAGRYGSTMRPMLLLALWFWFLAGCCDDAERMTRGDAVDEFTATACDWLVACEGTPLSVDACAARMRAGLCADGSCGDTFENEAQLGACVDAHAVGVWSCERYPRMPDACNSVFDR